MSQVEAKAFDKGPKESKAPVVPMLNFINFRRLDVLIWLFLPCRLLA